jgi:thioredoxin
MCVAITFQSLAQTTDAKSKQELTIEEFDSKLKKAGANAQILDARTLEEYQQNHLKGAVLFSVADEAELQKQIDKLDKQKPTFVYSINNGRSTQLAKKLQGQNFVAVYNLPGGISHWIGSGRPVESTVSNGLTFAEYKKSIQSDKLVLVDVHSKYCGGCKKLLPIVDSVSRENANDLKVVKVELFENKNLAKDLDIESIPTLILYKGDKIVWKKSGVTPKTEIQAAITKNGGVN